MMVDFLSPASQDLFHESYKEVFFRLCSRFQPQLGEKYSALACTNILLSAQGARFDIERCQEGLLSVGRIKFIERVRKEGFNISEACRLFREHGIYSDEHQFIQGGRCEDFRENIIDSCKKGLSIVTVGFSEKALGLSGNIHFSPIGAYASQSDMVLVMDVAAHKRDWYWLSLKTLCSAMQAEDKSCPYGWIVSTLKKPA